MHESTEEKVVNVNLKCSLPDSVLAGLSAQLGPGQEVRYAVQADLTAERHYGTSYLIVTGSHIAMANAEVVTETLPMSEVKEIRIDELFGSSCLLAVLDDKGRGEKRAAISTLLVPVRR